MSAFKQFDVPLMFRLWQSDLTNEEIGWQLGISKSLLTISAKRYALGPRPKAVKTLKRTVDPTPEEIADRAAEVRASWTPAEEAMRLVGGLRRRWTPPNFVHTGGRFTHAG